MNLLRRFINAINKGYRYSIASKLSGLEFSIIVVSLLIPLLYYLNNAYVILIYISIVISIILTIKDHYFEKNKNWTNFYKTTFWAIIVLQIINAIALFVASQGMELTILIVFSIGMILYFLMCISLVIFILNVVFWIGLKFVLPYETTDALTKRDVPLKELSKYMPLNDQVIYFMIMVLHFFMRQGIALYIYFLVLIYSKETTQNVNFADFINKIKSFEIISVGNLLGLISILIAIVTVTLQAQLKIEKSAYLILEKQDIILIDQNN